MAWRDVMDTSGTLNESWKESDLPHVGLVRIDGMIFESELVAVVVGYRSTRNSSE